MKIFVDTNALIYIAKAVSGQDNVTEVLNEAFNHRKDDLIITDTVLAEATVAARKGYVEYCEKRR